MTQRYRGLVHDNARWDGFKFRDGDIIISTPPKCGTTWTQTICALLLFQTPDLPAHVDILSPWLDQCLRPLDSVVADLEGQEHRRFIKTHTPLDGLPLDDRVSYVCVGRDPRDVIMSWDNHMHNLDLAAFFALREKAVGMDDLADVPPPDLSAMALPLEGRFWSVVDDDAPLEFSLGNLHETLHHFTTFIENRSRQNVILMHYTDMKDDLEGQMRMLAGRLGIDMPEDRWPALVEAATFENMKARAADFAPNTTEPIWLSNEQFFNKGTNGQWRDVITTQDDLDRYAARVADLCKPDVSEWAHRGPITL